MKQELIIVLFGSIFLYTVWYMCTTALHTDFQPRFEKIKRYEKIHALTTTIMDSDKIKELISFMKVEFSNFQAAVRLRKQSPDTCPCSFDRVLSAEIGGNLSQLQPLQNIKGAVPVDYLPGQTST